jgi:ParB-like chromosome segregation protein Spo0J
MSSIRELAVKRGELVYFHPSQVKIKDGLNARNMQSPEIIEHIEEIKTSIMERGFLSSKPLEVFSEGDDIFVSAGHCRLLAVFKAIDEGCEVNLIPCVIEAKGTNDTVRSLNQISDNSGKPLTILEAGKNIQKAIANGWEIPRIAKFIGKSVGYVYQAIDFQAAPGEVHKAVIEGDVSPTLAAAVVREHGNVEGAKIIREGVKEARRNGKKLTAKHLPSVVTPSKATLRVDHQLQIRREGPSLASVKFGEREPIILEKNTWLLVAQQITREIESMAS